ncbi:GerMN domain-containing protein [uncultured Brachyspira sp.]|uniref:GerMN domain-containing protein n=1 Tax=uncultured Brachyspira sp. TaxID=221953 RepID=UPI0025DED5F6|nr:GerMN domain-containing protein [uncultured Brachyspira sp.]
MPRYEQLKSKSKSISYTRQIRNENKETNLKKPIIISIIFIIMTSVIFTVVKKYSPMVDIAIKDFFSINHKEALVLESDGISEDQNKMSFLNNIPLFNFFIKEDTNKTLSVMTYETNSKIEAALNMNANDDNERSQIITRESLLPFFNNSGKNNSIIYDNNYIDYGNNHESVLFSNDKGQLLNDRKQQNNNTQIEEHLENEKTYNYLEQMILENRNNNTQNEISNIKNSSIDINIKTNSNEQNNSQFQKGMFDNILKPKENNSRRETTTMKPASTTSFSKKAPPSYINETQNNNNNDSYDFNIDKYLKKDTPNNNNTERIINNNIEKTDNNEKSSKEDIIKSSIYTITKTNSFDKSSIDYNRVINDMVNPNNSIKRDNNIVAEEKKESIIKENRIIKNDDEYKKEIIKKAQNDINNYNIKKANNSISRDLKDRKLKDNNSEGIYLVEYNENTGSITLIFRERKFNNKLSIEKAINELLIGATDEENNRNIISCIPRDTKLLDLFIEKNTVYLNFNENFEFNPLGNEGTMVQIYQFVYTATQFEGIDNVIFLINGKLNETIGAEGAIENMPFRRFK